MESWRMQFLPSVRTTSNSTKQSPTREARNFPPFMKHECWLLKSEEVATCLYAEPVQSSQTPNIFFLQHDFKVSLSVPLKIFAFEFPTFFLRIRN